MNIRSEYKNDVNTFVDQHCKLTAQDIWERAKTVDNRQSKQKQAAVSKTFLKLMLPIACVLALGMSVLAGSRLLSSDWFRETFKDETTAQIVDEGYLAEYNMVKEQDIFKTELLALTGDLDNPYLIFDVYINDDDLAAKTEKIQFSAYVLSKEVYEKELPHYGTADGEGVKDAENPNLFHVALRAYPVWINSGDPIVVDVSLIQLWTGDQWIPYDLHMRYDLEGYDFTTETNVLHPVDYRTISNIKVERNGVRYHMNRIAFGEYDTEINFNFTYDHAPFAAPGKSYSDLEMLIEEECNDFISQIKLVVDGVEYSHSEDMRVYVDCDQTEAYSDVSNRCYASPLYPAVDYKNAKQILIRIGDKEYEVGEEDIEGQAVKMAPEFMVDWN